MIMLIHALVSNLSCNSTYRSRQCSPFGEGRGCYVYLASQLTMHELLYASVFRMIDTSNYPNILT